VDLWDWFIDLWFFARLREYLEDRRYRGKRERAWGSTQIALAKEGHRPEPELPGSSI